MLEDIRLDQSDYFDSDYFAYLEDSDLNWRAQLSGWRCLYQPDAVAVHSRQHATSRSLVIQRHAHANRYLGILKNASLRSLLVLAPHILVYEAHRTLKTIFRRPGLLPAYLKVLRLASRALRKRRTIQRHRRVSSRHLRSLMVSERYAREVAGRLGARSRARSRGPETRRDRAPA